MKGCFFKKLQIDVTNKTFCEKPMGKKLMTGFLGGKRLGTQLLLDYNPAGVDALGPDNHLIIAKSPLSGSSLYGSSRYGLFAKSPLTGFYGESYSGGNFAGPLARTGYDAVIIKGASKSPIWIEINSDTVLFHDACEIWGRDTFETEDYLKNKSSGKHARMMVIGSAGENLARFAVIKNDKYHVAGRPGMGTVLGSKKIQQGNAGTPVCRSTTWQA
jgi:aldehyde:ferredoxin oxidoreductase